jgi:transposase
VNGEQKEYLGRLCEVDGALADARRLTQEFNGVVRNLEGEKLDGWLEEPEACGAPAMRSFATGLRKDLQAVRAGFELLKARMLAA